MKTRLIGIAGITLSALVLIGSAHADIEWQVNANVTSGDKVQHKTGNDLAMRCPAAPTAETPFPCTAPQFLTYQFDSSAFSPKRTIPVAIYSPEHQLVVGGGSKVQETAAGCNLGTGAGCITEITFTACFRMPCYSMTSIQFDVEHPRTPLDFPGGANPKTVVPPALGRGHSRPLLLSPFGYA